MNDMLKRIKTLLPSKRKIMQLYFAVLFNANLKGFLKGSIYQGNSKSFCVPGLNCYSCPGAVAACPLGALQGSFSADRTTVYYICGILLLYCVMFGRMICGWLCPFGLIQELFYKIKTPKLKKSPFTLVLSSFKYVVLVFFVLIVPIMYAFRDIPLPAFCKYICPAGTLEGGIGLLSNAVNASYFSLLGPLFTWKFLLMVSILTSSVFIFRMFCRFICPLGALYGLFNKLSLFGIKVDTSKCIDCGLCVNTCKLDIRYVGDPECISCGECVDICPTKAIRWKGNRIMLKANEHISGSENRKKAQLITRSVTAILMLAVLAGALVCYWHQDSSSAPSSGIHTAQRGNQVGDRCYGAQLEIVDASGTTGKFIDPTATGKTTVINFWGTWCTPCVNELPYFDRIASEYADSVTVIAVHSSVSKQTAPNYIAEHFPESSILFSWDTGEGFNGDYYSALGGRGTYPYTLILDKDGIVRHIFLSSLTYEELKAAIKAAQ